MVLGLVNLGVDPGADVGYTNKIAPKSESNIAIDTELELVYVRKSRENPGACSLETK